ncbi:MAG TPA: hypothetical protein VLE96_05045 [Chlamydiales bacterium]|nr:hypothetical protein [Chlamydiales bacterium]
MATYTDINDFFLKAHALGVKRAIDLAIRTKTSLVIEENGKIKSIKPKFKYVLVPIKSKRSSKKKD